MDTTTRGVRLSPRARRAIPLIVAAVLVTAGASVAYLQPSLLQFPRAAAPAKPADPAVLSGDYAAAYSFLTPKLGWALVVETTSSTPRFSVLRTTDAAKHWNRQFTHQLNLVSLETFTVRFFDPSHGLIAVGNPMEIYRTSDGGAHWAPVKTPVYLYSSFAAADPLRGWLLGWSGPPDQLIPNLFSTSDAGDTWTALPQALAWANGSAGFRSANLSFRNPREGWVGASAAEAVVYSSTDGGASWHPHALPNNLASSLCSGGKPLPPGEQGQLMTDVSLLPGHGVVAILSDYCGHGEGYTSFDGGVNWRRLASPPGPTSVWDFVYQDYSHWWAMRSHELWKSSDAGQSWKMVSLQVDSWDYLPHVIDANHAWAELYSSAPSGAPGAGLAATSDGGLHWSQVSAPQPG